MYTPIYEKTWSVQLKLTMRELDALACLTEYQSSKKIAKLLNISPRTAEAHIFNVTHKLGKSTRTSVVELIKNSDYHQDLKLHFSHLNEAFHFREHMKNIKRQGPLSRETCHLSCADLALKRKIEIDFAALNISCLDQPRENFKTIHVQFINNYPYTLFSSLSNVLTETLAVQQAISFFKKQDQQEIKNQVKIEKMITKPSVLFLFLCVSITATVYHTGFFSAAQTIRSDFCVPLESQSLQRAFVLKQIQLCFKKNRQIECVALVGIGGAGKTTLARQYAKQQNCPLVWEINAENHSVLVDAIAQLSHNLSKTSEEKNELECLQRNNTNQAYEEKLIHIMKQKLKRLKNWFLIFDNVESLAVIQKFLPSDSRTCGSGKILITTRNNNIADNTYVQVNNAIFVPPLSEEEKKELFFKLKGPSIHDKKKFISFLKTLPPFPLDIVLASTYLKNTGGFGDQSQKLYRLEEKQKIRFHLIDRTVQNLIARYPASLPILLFLTQIGGEEIPKELLWFFERSRAHLNAIITELAKQSLITYGFNKNKTTDVFYVHRSTQNNILMSLMQKFGKQNLTPHIKSLIRACENHCLTLRKRSDIAALNNLAYHLKILNTNNSLLNAWQTKSIQSLLGSIYVDLGYYRLASNLLENSKNYFQEHDKTGKHHETRYTLCYLGIAEKEMRNHPYAFHLLETAKNQCKKHHVDVSDYYFNLMQLHSCHARAFEEKEKVELLNMKKIIIDCIMVLEKDSPLDLNLAMAYQELGMAYLFIDKKYEQAEHCLRKSIISYQKIYGRESIKLITVETWLSILLRFQGKYKEALEILATIDKKPQFIAQQNGITKAHILIAIGENYRKLGQMKKAEYYFSEGMRLYEHEKNDLMKYWGANFLAKFYMETARVEEAMAILERSLKEHQNVLGPKNFKIAWVSHLLAVCHMKRKNYAQAEHFFKDSLEIYENFYGRYHHVYGLVLKDYGLLCALRGNPHKGIVLIKNAEKIFIALNHPARQKCQAYLKKIQWILK